MRKDYSPGVLKAAPKATSELAARDTFNRDHPPIEGLAAHDLRKMELRERPWRSNRGQWFGLAGYEDLDPSGTARYLAVQDTGLLRTMRLHQIEQYPVQLSPEEARELLEAHARP